MKTVIPGTPRRLALTLGCLLLCAGSLAYAKVEGGVDTLVNFNGKNGAQPQSITEDSDGNFYGTTLNGGKYSKGTVFEVHQDGEFETLVHFDGGDGAAPGAGLLLGPDNTLYGTTTSGGSDNKGTIFKITPKGQFSTLVHFTGGNGAQPDSGLFWGPDNNIYGSTKNGGANGQGLVFKISPTGQLTNLVTFDGHNGSHPGSLARDEHGIFYGTANTGGPSGKGLVFRLDPNGNLSPLVVFTGPNGAFPVSGINLSKDGSLYGATSDGGDKDLGLVYKLTLDGKFSILASFNGDNGAHPDSNLVEWNNGYFYMIRLWQNMEYKSAAVQWSGNNFCGTTREGGPLGNGTVFRVGDEGNLVVLVSFTGAKGISLGATPNSLVPGQDGNLYGTTGFGGHDSQGTIFRLQLQLWPLPVAGASDGADAGAIKLPIVSR